MQEKIQVKVPPEIIEFAQMAAREMGLEGKVKFTFVPGILTFPVNGYVFARGSTDILTGDVVIALTGSLENIKRTIIHELAHVKAGTTGHGPEWRGVYEHFCRRYGLQEIETGTRWLKVLYLSALAIVTGATLYYAVRELRKELKV